MAIVDYSGARVKIQRAKTHIAEFDYTVFTYLRCQPYRSRQIVDTETGEAGFKIALKQPFPVEAAAALGDAVHNLRAALDHLIAAAAITHGRSANDTAFPFAASQQDFIDKRLKDKARKAGPVAMTLCEELKPYPGGNDSLVGLHALDLIDKHRLLLAAVAAGDFFARFLPRLGQPQVVIEHRVYFLGNVPQFVPAPPGREFDHPFEIGLRLEIVFPANGPFAGIPCLTTLNELTNIVEGVVELFALRLPAVD